MIIVHRLNPVSNAKVVPPEERRNPPAVTGKSISDENPVDTLNGKMWVTATSGPACSFSEVGHDGNGGARNVPRCPPDDKPDLTPAQERAIDLLITGTSVTVAAAEVGVDRRTLHRWRTDDPLFIATLNARRLELREAGRARLLMLIDKAADVVSGSIEAGDVKTALQVLNGLRLIGPKAEAEPTETDATVIAGEIRERKLFAQLKASL